MWLACLLCGHGRSRLSPRAPWEQPPCPWQPHMSAPGARSGHTWARPPPASAPSRKAVSSDASTGGPPCPPDVLQGPLFLPVINHLRGGILLFSTELWQPEQQARVTWSAGAHARHAGLGGAGPVQKGHVHVPRAAAGPRAGLAGPSGFLVSPSLPLAFTSLYSQRTSQGPLGQRGRRQRPGRRPTQPSLHSQCSPHPRDRHIWGDAVRVALWSWRLGPLSPGSGPVGPAGSRWWGTPGRHAHTHRLVLRLSQKFLVVTPEIQARKDL